ncbi:hypothetical protein PsorP6_017135 [Peronosclerospora sorghi]|uniref:Uncharacterized protein n=1 Tax=Peronosclerospora sorghi TaxID=230839 RepID=A0ACC0WEU9_9STRA|nr:hypothetical protein PsorP6_017135 [Peronosclerospora sorghi]
MISYREDLLKVAQVTKCLRQAGYLIPVSREVLNLQSRLCLHAGIDHSVAAKQHYLHRFQLLDERLDVLADSNTLLELVCGVLAANKWLGQ